MIRTIPFLMVVHGSNVLILREGWCEESCSLLPSPGRGFRIPCRRSSPHCWVRVYQSHDEPMRHFLCFDGVKAGFTTQSPHMRVGFEPGPSFFHGRHLRLTGACMQGWYMLRGGSIGGTLADGCAACFRAPSGHHTRARSFTPMMTIERSEPIWLRSVPGRPVLGRRWDCGSGTRTRSSPKHFPFCPHWRCWAARPVNYYKVTFPGHASSARPFYLYSSDSWSHLIYAHRSAIYYQLRQ